MIKKLLIILSILFNFIDTRRGGTASKTTTYIPKASKSYTYTYSTNKTPRTYTNKYYSKITRRTY